MSGRALFAFAVLLIVAVPDVSTWAASTQKPARAVKPAPLTKEQLRLVVLRKMPRRASNRWPR
jgi:hypothetical protein